MGEERKQQQEEWRLKQLEKKVEALDDQPYVSEITLIEQTVKFCKDLLPQDAGKKEEEKKEIEHNNEDGEMVLLSKEKRAEEYYYAPTKKGKKGKTGGAKSEADGSKKPIKHNAETFKLFDSLKLDPPLTVAQIPALLEKLEAQKAEYDAKVKDWELNKEEMKRKIKEGIITAEDLEEEEKKEKEPKEEEEEKEEEKAEEP